MVIAALDVRPAAGGPLNWEWYVGAFVGAAFPASDDLKVESSFTDTVTSPFFAPFTETLTETVKARGANFDTGPVAGVKGGFCPGFLPYVCAELGFAYLSPSLSSQVTAGETQASFDGTVFFTSNSAQLVPIDLSVWELGLALIGRLPLLRDENYPLEGRLHLYLGAGPTVVWTRARNVCAGIVGLSGQICGGTGTSTSLGVQALGGVKFFITRNLAVFGEYQFKHWTADFDFSGSTSQSFGSGISVTTQSRTRVTDLDFNIQTFSIGLAFHF
jgi:hypothetical protein